MGCFDGADEYAGVELRDVVEMHPPAVAIHRESVVIYYVDRPGKNDPTRSRVLPCNHVGICRRR